MQDNAADTHKFFSDKSLLFHSNIFSFDFSILNLSFVLLSILGKSEQKNVMGPALRKEGKG